MDCASSSELLIHSTHGYISSYVARMSGCGNMDHPWKIEVLPGQRVNFTMQHFGHETASRRKCKPLGYVMFSKHSSV